MVDITDQRQNIQEEESDFNSAISEAYAFKVGSSINFINNKQYDSHIWIANGVTSLFTSLTGLDGAFQFLFDAELMGVALYFQNKTFTGSGLTKYEIDLVRVTSPGSSGSSLFSTLPAIDDTSPNTNSYFVYNFNSSSFTKDVTGSVAPVLASGANVDAGDLVTWSITETISTMEDASVRLFYRPR